MNADLKHCIIEKQILLKRIAGSFNNFGFRFPRSRLETKEGLLMPQNSITTLQPQLIEYM